MSETESINVETIEEAEKIILEHVNNGKNYRDIAQITFDVNGTVKRFNPSQISKIKAKNEESQAQNAHDPDKSLVFKKFRKGKTPIDVIIETGLDYDYVINAYEEYLDLEDKTVVYQSWIDNLHKMSMEIIKPCGYSREKDIVTALERAKDSHLKLKNFVCTCSVCEESMSVNDEMMEDAHHLAGRCARGRHDATVQRWTSP